MRLHLPDCPRNTVAPKTKSDAQLNQKREKRKPKKNGSKKGEGRKRIRDIIQFLYFIENNFI